jgi:hypothetical protein
MQQEDSTRLQDFVQASKAKGASDECIAAILTRRGWPPDDVYDVLGRYWETVTGVTIPERTSRGESARDAFFYLLSFSTLATWSAALGSMLFQFIDYWLPDPVSRSYVYSLRSSVTWQMASIAVAFPIYLLVMRMIFREAASHPERLQSGVRKWLTYIALLCTAGTMIGDLIWFLDYFLTGEITLRFVLKASAVMLICGAIFAYYVGSLRWNRSTNVVLMKPRNLIFGVGSAIVVVSSFCIGLGLAGTPSQQRKMEADARRIQDLRSMANAIKLWHDRAVRSDPSSTLPATLADLTARHVITSGLTDPETRQPYEYHLKSGSGYELCANFNAESESTRSGGIYSTFWDHRRGKVCFALEASQPVPWSP